VFFFFLNLSKFAGRNSQRRQVKHHPPNKFEATKVSVVSCACRAG